MEEGREECSRKGEQHVQTLSGNRELHTLGKLKIACVNGALGWKVGFILNVVGSQRKVF